MEQAYTARAAVTIDAPVERVWEALVNPELVKQYLFGTQVTSDWKVGSPITYRGEWEGRSYEDKGKILEIEPGKRLVSTYWSSMSGLPDSPEHYATVRYELTPENGATRVTVTQDNNRTQQDTNHSEQNWKVVLEGMKTLLEAA